MRKKSVVLIETIGNESNVFENHRLPGAITINAPPLVDRVHREEREHEDKRITVIRL